MSVHLKENLFREIMEIFKILSRQVTQHNHFFLFNLTASGGLYSVIYITLSVLINYLCTLDTTLRTKNNDTIFVCTFYNEYTHDTVFFSHELTHNTL